MYFTKPQDDPVRLRLRCGSPQVQGPVLDNSMPTLGQQRKRERMGLIAPVRGMLSPASSPAMRKDGGEKAKWACSVC